MTLDDLAAWLDAHPAVAGVRVYVVSRVYVVTVETYGPRYYRGAGRDLDDAVADALAAAAEVGLPPSPPSR